MVFTTRAGRLIFTRLPRFPRFIAPLVSLALAVLACGITPTVTRQPASQLRLSIAISGQYTGNTSIVLIDIRIYDSSNNALVFAPKSARLTCEGADVKPDYETPMRECPRQPPGGAYVITYTDEHGVATTATIPVPLGRLALLMPRAGSTVLIPGSRPLNTPTPYVVPTPTPHFVPTPYDPSATAPMFTPTPGPGLDIVYEAPLAPQGGSVTLDELSVECGDWKVYNCGDQVFTLAHPDGPATGTTKGGKQSFLMTGDFTQFRPGPGAIRMATTVHLTPESGGFAGVTATFQDSIVVPITWTK